MLARLRNVWLSYLGSRLNFAGYRGMLILSYFAVLASYLDGDVWTVESMTINR